MTPLQKLIFDALTFAEIAAGEGIYFTKTHKRPGIDPADFLLAYSMTTGDEDWENFALRLSMRVAEMEALERKALEANGWV
jgi:hypothetical protein